ncbi:MAG TPA: 1-deoxy-D-xylulose-5-phosphate synthase [Firmicutes bacterium]|nr:1-deoxy-D-xylulose-5-phosphate synthase [Bacillota bacterium]
MPTRYPILTRVNTPEDLKSLSLPELRGLCRDIREFLIQNVSQTGGHLASNLGSVELTVALHAVFDSPRDKFVWDVGHQGYPHKILTGRKDRFNTLRQRGGISGFPNPQESEHDTFVVGHASTSLAAAMGMAKARDLKGDDHNVIAIIGDGAMTGGIAFEAINNASNLPTRLIIILNDNKMSISPNVGGMSRHLTYLRTIPSLRNIKAGTIKALRRVPLIGKRIARSIDAASDSLFYFVTPTRTGVMFEEFGFTYLGPFDGHNLKLLMDVLRSAKNWTEDGPILIHVLTVKGKGFIPAEGSPTNYHGVGAFDPSLAKADKVPDKGQPSKMPSYTQIFSDALLELAVTDQKICAITAAMAEGTGLDAFRDRIRERFFDVGIAEQFAVTYASGLAIAGMKPVCAIYSTFLQRAFDQCIHDVGIQNLPVVFALDRGGIVGSDGATHHGAFDLSYLRLIPNFTIMAPKDESELRDMVYTAIEHDGPVAFRYPRGDGEGVDLKKGFSKIPIGKAEVVREGGDVLLIGIGNMVYRALEAAEKLAKIGVEAAVINARFVKPLDKELIIEWVLKTRRVITIEENSLMCGFGSAVLEMLQEEGVLEQTTPEFSERESQIEIERLGIPDTFIEHGSQSELRKEIGLTSESIYETARSMVGKVKLSLLEVEKSKKEEPGIHDSKLEHSGEN